MPFELTMRTVISGILNILLALVLASCSGGNDAALQIAAQDGLVFAEVSGVAVEVKDKVATLTGEVSDGAVRNKAESAVRAAGITIIRNNITIKPVSQLHVESNPKLKTLIEDKLKSAGCGNAVVEFGYGTVILSGTVPDAKYVECIQIVNRTGAGRMENNLKVENR